MALASPVISHFLNYSTFWNSAPTRETPLNLVLVTFEIGIKDDYFHRMRSPKAESPENKKRPITRRTYVRNGITI